MTWPFGRKKDERDVRVTSLDEEARTGEISLVDKILELRDLFGLTRFSAHMDVGAPSHERMMKSIEVFGTQIAPKVRAALKK